MAATLHEENGSTMPVGMVVDDDELVRESVVAMLEDLCDRVYQASDGVEGLEVLRRSSGHFVDRHRYCDAAPGWRRRSRARRGGCTRN